MRQWYKQPYLGELAIHWHCISSRSCHYSKLQSIVALDHLKDAVITEKNIEGREVETGLHQNTMNSDESAYSAPQI